MEPAARQSIVDALDIGFWRLHGRHAFSDTSLGAVGAPINASAGLLPAALFVVGVPGNAIGEFCWLATGRITNCQRQS